MPAKRASGYRSSTIELRIIGGALRGSKIQYAGEPGTRPMKDRVREAVFNLLGQSVKGSVAIDLFAGTGALALEAISRGATRAVAIEKHFPMAATLQANAESLGVADRVELHAGDAFIWGQQLPDFGPEHWSVFCSPPYLLYHRCRESVLQLLADLMDAAPLDSAFIVEADERFDFDQLPDAVPTGRGTWDVRKYPPAIVGIWRKASA
jgi:16S rRNA (guanine966-N2)-methyltransferase